MAFKKDCKNIIVKVIDLPPSYGNVADSSESQRIYFCNYLNENINDCPGDCEGYESIGKK